MAISQDHQTLPRFRFRVSTVLVCFGLIFLPWAAYFFDRPHFLGDKGFAAATFNFVVYDFSVQVMFFGFIVAFGSLFWFAYKRHWRAFLQSLLEMVVCFLVQSSFFRPTEPFNQSAQPRQPTAAAGLQR